MLRGDPSLICNPIRFPVLLTATSYPVDTFDWRGRFIYDMVGALSKRELIDLRVWAPPGELPFGAVPALVEGDADWLAGLARRGGIAHLLRQQPIAGLRSALLLLLRLRRAYRGFAAQKGGRLVHANWLQTALPLWGTQLPALITVLGSDLALLRLPGMVVVLRSMLRGRRVILAPNANWMQPILSQHFGDLAEVRSIPFGVDERWFSVERNAAATVSGDWLVVSRITRAKLGHLFDWGKDLFGGARRLHLLGPMQEQIELPEWVVYHGHTNPDALATEWFPRVAGLLTLSLHDEGRPQVMLEAMAAGLPVIATDSPAHRDLLKDGLTGYLVANEEEFCKALVLLDTPTCNLSMGQAGRSWMIENIGTWDDCALRYIKAYNDLLVLA